MAAETRQGQIRRISGIEGALEAVQEVQARLERSVQAEGRSPILDIRVRDALGLHRGLHLAMRILKAESGFRVNVDVGGETLKFQVDQESKPEATTLRQDR